MAYKTKVVNKRFEGEPPEQDFKCDIQVVDEDGEVMENRPFSYRIGGPVVTQQSVQKQVDKIKEDLLNHVRNKNNFDPDDIN